MGDLKNQIFLQYINRAIDLARQEFIQKNVAKKESRFLIKGITYEISHCRFLDGKFVYEISSKIPQDLIQNKSGAEKYFHQVVKMMNGMEKKPSECKMENIVYNTTEMEHKERDYVKLQFRYGEDELYSLDEVDKRFKKHQAKSIPIPDIPGITTPSGKLVIIIVEEKMARFIRQNVNDLVHCNEEVKKKITIKPERPAKKTAPAKKAEAKAPTMAKVSAKKTKKPAVAKKSAGSKKR